MEIDDNVYMMGEDIGIYKGAFGVSDDLFLQFGSERIIDTPISEAGFVGVAIGSAISGMRPIVEIMFSDFLTVCFDMIVNQAAKMSYMFGGKINVPIVIRTAAGGQTGAASQHSQSLEAMLCHVPGIKVVAPSTAYDAKGLLKASIRDNNPVIFLEQKILYQNLGEVPNEDYEIPLGVCDVKKEGRDITIITYGSTVFISLEAAKIMKEYNIDVEVLDLRTLYPLDKKGILTSIMKTKRCIIVHEAVKTGGLGGEISATIAESEAFNCLKSPILRVCAKDAPIPFAKNLEDNFFPTAELIVDAIKNIFEIK